MHKLKKVLVIGHSPHSAKGKSSQNFAHRLYEILSSKFDAWYLGAEENLQIDATKDTLFLGESSREMLFFSSLDPLLGNQLNQDILLGAFPRLLKQLSPEVVHIVNPHQLGFEFLWLTAKLLPNCVRVVSFSDASAICSLNASLVRKSGNVCSGPSPRACSHCKPEISAAEFVQSLNYLRNSLTCAHRITVPQERYIKAFQTIGINVVLGPQMSLVNDAKSVVSKQPSPAIKFGYFGPLVGEGARMVSEAVRIVAKGTDRSFQVDMFPTDLYTTECRQYLQKLNPIANLSIQSSWNDELFAQYVSGYPWVILPNVESNKCVQWACTAYTEGISLIAPLGLSGLENGAVGSQDSEQANGTGNPPDIQMFLEGSASSLAQVLINILHLESGGVRQHTRASVHSDLNAQVNELYFAAL